MAGCMQYKEPPGINTRPVDSGANETTSSTAESGVSTEPGNEWEEILTYAEYLEMTAQERSEFADSFEDSAEFFQWLQVAKAAYEQNRMDNALGEDGIIDMDKINPNG